MMAKKKTHISMRLGEFKFLLKSSLLREDLGGFARFFKLIIALQIPSITMLTSTMPTVWQAG